MWFVLSGNESEGMDGRIDRLVRVWSQLNAREQFLTVWKLRLRVWPRRIWRYVRYLWLAASLYLRPTGRRVWRFQPVEPMIIGDTSPRLV